MNNEQTRTSGRGRESHSPGAHLGLTRTAAATKGDGRGTAVSAATTDRAAAVGRRGEIIVSTVDGIGYCNLCGYNTTMTCAILALQEFFLSFKMKFGVGT